MYIYECILMWKINNNMYACIVCLCMVVQCTYCFNMQLCFYVSLARIMEWVVITISHTSY